MRGGVAHIEQRLHEMTSSDHTTGAAAVGEHIAGRVYTSATFRVWFPATVALDVSDDVLGT